MKIQGDLFKVLRSNIHRGFYTFQPFNHWSGNSFSVAIQFVYSAEVTFVLFVYFYIISPWILYRISSQLFPFLQRVGFIFTPLHHPDNFYLFIGLPANWKQSIVWTSWNGGLQTDLFSHEIWPMPMNCILIQQAVGPSQTLHRQTQQPWVGG